MLILVIGRYSELICDDWKLQKVIEERTNEDSTVIIIYFSTRDKAELMYVGSGSNNLPVLPVFAEKDLNFVSARNIPKWYLDAITTRQADGRGTLQVVFYLGLTATEAGQFHSQMRDGFFEYSYIQEPYIKLKLMKNLIFNTLEEKNNILRSIKTENKFVGKVFRLRDRIIETVQTNGNIINIDIWSRIKANKLFCFGITLAANYSLACFYSDSIIFKINTIMIYANILLKFGTIFILIIFGGFTVDYLSKVILRYALSRSKADTQSTNILIYMICWSRMIQSLGSHDYLYLFDIIVIFVYVTLQLCGIAIEWVS
ncbi:MAG: hypothetical protein FWH40_08180 [Coriobacteriia bacterium]|nr:hypothetical protein [Coriobacteriia bacterium]